MNRLGPGEELVLLPGRYKGPCSIRAGGTAQRPIVIRSADPERPAVLAYAGRTANVLDVRADHVVVRGLAFESIHPAADGVRIYARNDVVVEDCQFKDLGGIAVVANHHSARGIVVRRNIVKQSRATAMYFGCHDGKACVIEELLIERNYIHGVTAPDPMIGYGIQVKMNSVASVRDNVIVDTKGPGIMVYGAWDRNSVSVIERNFVQGSRNSGIVIGGGPARVHNNISIGNAQGGIQLHDYSKRGLLRDIVVRHNTLLANEKGALMLNGAEKAEGEITFNAVAGPSGKVALPETRDKLVLKENRNCSHVACFTDPEQLNFSPVESSILLGIQDKTSFPIDDFFGRLRGEKRAVGAVEPGGAPIHIGIKSVDQPQPR
ncbi:MAG TPA: right-handed parallel beta-helix repeat-containing protein [Candidatus Binatia bacterium]|nr:right-handed parallel beta-helix repeat-containing protein [Candidatus Binatia bacterium]